MPIAESSKISVSRGVQPSRRMASRKQSGAGFGRSTSAPLGRVDGILSGADVEHAKPAPDCFLEAMRREGCTPQETLIFEDSEIGLEAARRSGV